MMSRTASGSSPTFAIVTLGCKVNQYESQAIREEFLGAGFRETGPLDNPEVAVVNSCGVTLHGSAESRQWMNRIRKRCPRTRIIATGCCTEIDPDAVAGADVIVPQPDKHALVDVVTRGVSPGTAGRIPEEAGTRRDPAAQETRFGPGSNIGLTVSRFGSHTRAFLRIQDGCSGRCAYCAVPLARGGAVSKPLETVLEEARTLSGSGYPEIVLCGVDLGAYGRDLGMHDGLVRVLGNLVETAGEARFRLSSIDVTDVTGELLKLMASNRRICSHIHMPLQSGDASVLEAMGRGYSPQRFLDTVEKARELSDEPAITTDCMVGFPGETDEAFENTLSLCRACGFSRIHVFRFSPRPRTAALELPGRLPERVLSRRARVLAHEAQHLAASYVARLVGESSGSEAIRGDAKSPQRRVLDVVIERAEEDFSYGLAARYVRVRIERCRPAGATLRALAVAAGDGLIDAVECNVR